MNTKVIKKCLDELEKESPKLDYVRGMLETLIDLDSNEYITAPIATPITPVINPTYGQTNSTADTGPGVESIPPGFGDFAARALTAG